MGTDYLAELKKQPYPLYKAPKPYSFDLNEDMVKMLRSEFNAEKVSGELMAAIKGKSKQEAPKAAEAFFKTMGVKWMNRTIQMADEYSDRTIEMILEAVDRQGKQFLIFPHVLQRYVEVANLSTQEFLKVPVVLNNKDELAYRIPKCALYAKITEKAGGEFAGLMTCKNYCLTALEIAQKKIAIETLLTMPSETAKDTFCEFDMKKL
jgi:hypothetical protein